jgi:methylmalonyl-CoA/ethylmalonyl-CoA epimerase
MFNLESEVFPVSPDITSPEPAWPTVVSATELSNSFLGELIEICIVTADHQRTMEGLVRLGIGPWRVYTFDSQTVNQRTYHGETADWAIKVCFADVGELAVEIMQPLYGPSIFQEHLDQHGEGIHHIAFDVARRPWQERLAAFAQRGFAVSQSGRFVDQNAFAFFATEAATSTTFETYDIPADFVWPEPEAWFPGPPPDGERPPARSQTAGS